MELVRGLSVMEYLELVEFTVSTQMGFEGHKGIEV